MTMLKSGIVDELLGKIYIPADLSASISLPGRGVKSKYAPGEIGIVIAKQQRPIYYDEGLLAKYETIWYSITHNERVDAGAAYQAQQVFAGGASPAAPSATVYFNVIAIANATLTKTKTDQSLGSASSGVTTNEFTTIGLSRATLLAAWELLNQTLARLVRDSVTLYEEREAA